LSPPSINFIENSHLNFTQWEGDYQHKKKNHPKGFALPRRSGYAQAGLKLSQSACLPHGG
jgi:hypothetical protein